jgi:hypothetical protein
MDRLSSALEQEEGVRTCVIREETGRGFSPIAYDRLLIVIVLILIRCVLKQRS